MHQVYLSFKACEVRRDRFLETSMYTLHTGGTKNSSTRYEQQNSTGRDETQRNNTLSLMDLIY